MARSAKEPSERNAFQRVFVNRSVCLEKIRFYGFDMDYTLAMYRSPDFEDLLYRQILERMIFMGYPEQLRNFNYDPTFAIRGLWFDQKYGNLLKVDGFGNILVGVHGLHFLKPAEIKSMYPGKFLAMNADPERVVIMNSLFNMADTYALATLIDYFDNKSEYKRKDDRTGVQLDNITISYKSIAQDTHSAVSYVHQDNESTLKNYVLKNIQKYIIKDPRITILLRQLQKHGAKTFLLTNSSYYYTNGVMKYLIGDSWTSYFDVTFVDAKKPLWFAQGTALRQVDPATGTPKLGIHHGPATKGQVFAGGNSDVLRNMFMAQGKNVMYIGDHLFGDVLKSKKTKVVPELGQEISIWADRHAHFEKLVSLSKEMEELYSQLGVESEISCKPDIQSNLKQIREITQEMDQSYSKMGSLFRSGSRTTFFATQVERFADLYSSSCYNLIYYPQFYFFRAAMTLMPHESTVDHVSRKMQPKVPSLPSQSPNSSNGWTYCHEEDDAPISEEGVIQLADNSKKSE
uniref:Tyrosine-protein phosphatase non-receptor type 9 n=2 Tax=Parascaris univalens TaxID=6257 RepID=A0A915AN30_PARUN